ncbi:MAG: DNA translocase FtsK, partial [Mariprofundaceae bacterium]
GKIPYLGHWTSLFWLPLVLAMAALMHAHLGAGLDIQQLAHKPAAGTGGALGAMFASALVEPFHAVGRDILLLTLAISSLVTASHLSLVMLVKRIAALIGRLLLALRRVAESVRDKASTRKERMEAREERQKTRETRPEHIAESEPEVAEQARVVISKRAKQEQQTELALKEPKSSSRFKLPSLNLFNKPKVNQKQHSPDALQAMARMLEKKLLDYRVEGQVVAVQPGPIVTQFEFEPAPGTKVSRIIALQDDLARAMAAISVRVAGNIPGKNAIGIELPNESREGVVLQQVLASKEFSDKRKMLPLALGVDIAGHPVVTDLAKMPHLLVAGTTGSGKSVSVNAMICSLLMTHGPDELRMIRVDPKMLELSVYDDIPHLLVPVVTNPHKAAKALAWAVYEMERRYQLMSDAKVRNLDGYNKAVARQKDGEAEHLPFIVIIIDELADLMMVA